jgi:hypothetical protein
MTEDNRQACLRGPPPTDNSVFQLRGPAGRSTALSLVPPDNETAGRAELVGYIELANNRGHAAVAGKHLCRRATLAEMAGRVAEAANHANAAVELGAAIGIPDAFGCHRTLRGSLAALGAPMPQVGGLLPDTDPGMRRSRPRRRRSDQDGVWRLLYAADPDTYPEHRETRPTAVRDLPTAAGDPATTTTDILVGSVESFRQIATRLCRTPSTEVGRHGGVGPLRARHRRDAVDRLSEIRRRRVAGGPGLSSGSCGSDRRRAGDQSGAGPQMRAESPISRLAGPHVCPGYWCRACPRSRYPVHAGR